jgi:hypothetical protein
LQKKKRQVSTEIDGEEGTLLNYIDVLAATLSILTFTKYSDLGAMPLCTILQFGILFKP